MKKFLHIILFFIGISNITAINTPTQSSPANGAVNQYTNEILWINQVTGATYYDYMLDTVITFNSPDLRTKTHTSSYAGWTTNDLYYGKTYYWKIRARNATDTSLWSSTWSFTTHNIGVSQSSPVSGASQMNLSLVLWINRMGSENYNYQLDTVASFDSPDLQEYTHTDAYGGQTVNDLRYGQKYYWRVRGINTNDTSNWTGTWNFTTKNYGVTLQSPYNNTTGLDPKLSLYINKVTGTENYDYQLDTVPTFDSPNLQESSHSSSFSGWTVSDLRYGQKYYWRVRGRNDTDTSAWTSIWNFTTKYFGVTLQSPYNNTTGLDPKLSLYINKVTGTENYDYQLDTVPTFDSPNLQELSHSSSFSGWTVSDLRYGQKYYWRVRGRNDTDTSVWTSIWNFTTKYFGVTLQSPYNNTTGLDPKLSLYINKVTGSENYDYQLDTVPTFNSADLQELSHTDTYSGWAVSDLRYGQKYYWHVRGRNDTDTSVWTSIWNFTTKYFGATPSSPAYGSENIPLNTTLWLNKVTGSENYDYQIDTSLNFNSPILAEYTHSDTYSGINISLTRYGQRYYWRVRGRNDTDTSKWSAAWNLKTIYEFGEAPILVAPSNNSTSISYSSVQIDWNSISNADDYQYQISTTNDFTNIVKNGTTNNTDKTITNLQANTTYYWRVRGENINGYSPWSTVWSFTTEDISINAPILTSPANNAINQLTDITLDWEDVTGATSYEYWYSTDQYFSTFISGTTGNTEILITGLNNNTTYYWKVIATDGTNYSNWSEVWNFTTEDAGSGIVTPTLISPENNAENQELSLTLLWNIVPSANEYQYQYSTDNTFATYMGSTTQSSSISISGLEYGTQYFWRIQATDGTQYSDWSEVWSFTTISETLAAPVLISPVNNATNQLTDITLDWNTVTNASEYEYQYSTDNSFSTYNGGTISESDILISDLEYGTEYFWRVQASDGTIFSEWSEVWSFTTKENTYIENVNISDVKIYPNPTDEILYIKSNFNIDYVKIIDLTGKEVYYTNKIKNEYKIETNKFKQGIYFIELIFGNDKITEKLFINH